MVILEAPAVHWTRKTVSSENGAPILESLQVCEGSHCLGSISGAPDFWKLQQSRRPQNQAAPDPVAQPQDLLVDAQLRQRRVVDAELGEALPKIEGISYGPSYGPLPS